MSDGEYLDRPGFRWLVNKLKNTFRKLGSIIPISEGGTGATNAADAREALGVREFIGVSGSIQSMSGLLPGAPAGGENKVFYGNGKWDYIKEFRGVSGSILSMSGLLPGAPAGGEDMVFYGRGEWGPVQGGGGHDDLIAPVESASGSEHAYAIGDQFIIEGVLYIATAVIAIGDAFVIGTNCAINQSITEQIKGVSGRVVQIDIVELNGVYGYIDSDGNFVDFKSQADIDAAVAAARVGTATAADVKAGVTFTNSTASGLTGTFAAQTKSATPALSAQTITPDSGKYLSSVSVSAISPDRSANSMIVPQWGSGSTANVPATRIATLNPRVNFSNNTTYGSAEMVEIAMPEGYYIWAYGKSSCCIPTETKTVSSGTSDQTITPTEYGTSGKYVKFLKSVKVNAISPQRSNGTYINSSGIDSTAPWVYIPYGWYPQYSGKPGYSYVYMTTAQAQALHKHTATYTPSANSSASDMGEKHNYRYVDTRTVYNLGYNAAGVNFVSLCGKYYFATQTNTAVVTTNRAYKYVVFFMYGVNNGSNYYCWVTNNKSLTGSSPYDLKGFNKQYGWYSETRLTYFSDVPNGTTFSFSGHWACGIIGIGIYKT